MEVTAPPPKKNWVPLFWHHQAYKTTRLPLPFTRVSPKKTQTSSVIKCECATLHIKHIATSTSLQNINWSLVSKNVSIHPVYIKKKMSVFPVYIPCSYNVFLYFLEGQVHKVSKLEIMTNVGRSHLYKRSQKE